MRQVGGQTFGCFVHFSTVVFCKGVHYEPCRSVNDNYVGGRSRPLAFERLQSSRSRFVWQKPLLQAEVL